MLLSQFIFVKRFRLFLISWPSIIVALCVISAMLGLHQLKHEHQTKISADDISDTLIHTANSSSSQKTNMQNGAPKTILLWNKFFYTMDYGVGIGTNTFEKGKCSRICNIVTDQELLPTADAVIVHMFYLPKDVPNATLPVRGHDKQIFVFYNLENPVRNQRGLTALGYRDVFNLTFTYMDDPQTDVFCPYGDIRRLARPVWTAMPPKSILETKKKKNVVWLVSNCLAPSSR